MTDLSKATVRPWKADEARFGYRHIREDPANWNGMGYQLICTVPAEGKRGTHFREMFDANAELIVRAVNERDELIAALRMAREFIQDCASLPEVDIDEDLAVIDAALAKVDAS